jgi:hypothetical protein
LNVRARKIQNFFFSRILTKILDTGTSINGSWPKLQNHGVGFVLSQTTEIEGNFPVLGGAPKSPVGHALAVVSVWLSKRLGQRDAAPGTTIQNEIVGNGSVTTELLNG